MNILLFNSISGRGHLDSWLLLFERELSALGHKIFILSKELDPTVELQKETLRLSWDLKEESKSETPNPRSISRFMVIYRGLNLKYNNHPFWVEERKKYNLTYRKTLKFVLPGFFKFLEFGYAFILFIRKVKLLGFYIYTFWYDLSYLKFANKEKNFFLPSALAVKISKSIQKPKLNVDLIIHLYTDFYSTSRYHWKHYFKSLPIPILGIHFNAQNQRFIDIFNESELSKGIFLLYNKELKEVSLKPEKIHILPDFTNVDLPNADSLELINCRNRIKGRIAIFLGGTIGPQKNLPFWFHLIGNLPIDKFFFIQVGEILWPHLDSSLRNQYHSLLESHEDNFFSIDRYLSSEKEFNRFLSISTLTFCVYKNFDISSNIVTKSAYFNIPILVSDGKVIKQRVYEYGIGIELSEEIEIDLIERNLKEIAFRNRELMRFKDYQRDFGLHKLKKVLESVIFV